ncbi:MAG: hypothetical protein ACLU4N_19620 [Butyricimonas faecihominis]
METDLGEVKYGTQFNEILSEEREIKARGEIGFRSEQVAELKINQYQLRLAEGAKSQVKQKDL